MLYILRLATSTLQQSIAVAFHFLTANHFQQIHNSKLPSQTMKHIVILGGSYAGVSTAHRLLKQAAKTGPIKITLVSPDTHFYWTMASSRAIVPGQFPDEKIFQPIAPGFEQYPADRFDFILASAKSLDVQTKKVGISSSTGNQELDYDFLIVATGSHMKEDTPLKGLGSTEATKKALHDFQARVKNAKTIVVAGGGVTGCEVAGELAFEYGARKEIILIASGKTVVQGAPDFVSTYTIRELLNLHVTLKFQTKVTSSTQTPTGQQELMLSSGEKLITDMYIPTLGLIPNTSYIPTKFLNDDGYVVVDEFLKVKGASSMWAIGDASAIQPPQWLHMEAQSKHLVKNLILILNNKAPLPYKSDGMRLMGIQIGKKKATGHFGSYRMPTWLALFSRKNLFTQKLVGTVDGSLF